MPVLQSKAPVSKRKHKHQHHIAPPSNPAVTPRQNGLKAFRRNDFNAAIDQWGRLDLGTDPAVRTALAEAHFRRALAVKDAAQSLADLARSTELMPGEGCYWYHLGLAHHRADQLDEALAAYARAGEAGFSRQGFGLVRGLAEVERDPHIDLETRHWLSPADRSALFPIAALLRGDAQAVLDARPGNWPVLSGVEGFDRLKAQITSNAVEQLSTLWRGLALIATGQMAQAQITPAPCDQ